ncbi:MAG: preprotein translocase subunit SecE [Candidatus Magnetobacterium sp. LHC-1]|uniref:Protein translocase subunit SecE n=1 Tax=Candidatus Magnetobacterium casense TaxID=1455061 RepID=A0ABS6RVJ0_9BACT|nr:preprotein translocase subunit SecE [Candidatus Magnetobacterium casensis]MBF0607736.1 preprotein translocase subunit SecE [Nitrospirota bacterium]MBV6340654.1 preprotein translocase subunit SecE [Candidatus Magnetobacterium casensis]
MVEKIKAFLKEVTLESKKVVYPSKDELIGSTWVVVIFSFVVSMFLGFVDLGLSKLVSKLIK